MNYLDLSLYELHDAILSNKVTPRELVEESLKRARKDQNNAFEYICEKEAFEQLNNLESCDKNSLFYGVPIALKDNFSTKNIPTSASSNILNGYVPIFDSEVALRLKKAGAILIGKTTLDELAMGGSGTTGRKGTSFNPWDNKHNHLIGGSSCGSAIAVCDDIVPFAIGSDTGDSIRKPASYAGLVGFKPTWGRISRFGLFPFAPSLDHVGYFTRSVKDSALALSYLAGHDDKDATSSYRPVEQYDESLTNSLKGKKIAVIKEVYDSITNLAVRAAFDKSVKYLLDEGVIVDYISFPEKLLKALYPTYIIISSAEATSNCANLDGIKFGARQDGNTFEEIITNTRTKGFSELIKRRFVIGSYSLLRENQDELFKRAQKCRRLIVDETNRIFANYDAIYLPASTEAAPIITGEDHDRLSDEYLIADNHLAIGNFGGYPSITLPIGFDGDLPFGANITCSPFQEKKMFNIAYQLERYTKLENLSARRKK